MYRPLGAAIGNQCTNPLTRPMNHCKGGAKDEPQYPKQTQGFAMNGEASARQSD
jgi:hypothetical protein